MIQLPHEIWEEICSFLDSNETKGLYAINSALFEIAMNERYRDISFTRHERKEVKFYIHIMYVDQILWHRAVVHLFIFLSQGT